MHPMWCYAGNPVDLGGTNWSITQYILTPKICLILKLFIGRRRLVMRDHWIDVRNASLKFLGPQTQGRHAALKIQVS